MNFERHIWEGWRVRDFIESLELTVNMIMNGQSYIKPFQTKDELKQYCKNNQPYYKKHIPEVVAFFCKKYGIKGGA